VESVAEMTAEDQSDLPDGPGCHGRETVTQRAKEDGGPRRLGATLPSPGKWH
jgi:hypothetical protein